MANERLSPASNYWTAQCVIIGRYPTTMPANGRCMAYKPRIARKQKHRYKKFLSKRLIIGHSLAEKGENGYLYPKTLRTLFLPVWKTERF